ncbi:MAG TPA: AraC family transcriptional regulator [Puia sp.]|nr:AraC family transcriptional regulator [Puia sp.]
MKYSENTIIIKEYLNAFRKYAKDGIVDMDVCRKHRFNFQIHRLEEIVSAWEGIIPAHRQSQFLITLIKKGTGEKTIGHFNFPIQKNILFVVPPRVPHSSKYRSLDCSGFMLSFDMAFFLQQFFPRYLIADKRIFKKSVRPFVVLTNEQTEELSAIFEGLLEEYNRQFANKDEMIAVKVLELLIQCERWFTGTAPYQNTERYSEIIESFNELILAHFSKEKSVRFYANSLHVHPNYLNFLMKKYTGVTAKQAIADHLVLEAKGLLCSPLLNIKEISYRLGFTTPGSFSSFFRKMSGMSPSEFRRQMRHL